MAWGPLPNVPSGSRKLPGGGEIWIVGSAWYVVYNIDGIYVSYSFESLRDFEDINLTNFPPPKTIDPAWNHQVMVVQKRGVHAGNVAELFGVREPSYAEWLNKQLLVFSGGNANMLKDRGVRRLLIERAAENISDQELVVRLKETDYWKKLTDQQREWAKLSPAEKQFRIGQAAAQLVQLWFANVGKTMSVHDPNIRKYAEMWASGQKSEGWILETWIKPEAMKNPESPWARQVREEQEEQRQRGVDVENTTLRVQDMYRRWGVPVSSPSAEHWAKRIVSNEASEADLINALKAQAQVLYPWKDPEIETATAAEPWMQTYARVLERPAPDIYNQDIQQALTKGMPIFEFEQHLKRSKRDQWLQTQNAKESISESAAQVSRIMGFS